MTTWIDRAGIFKARPVGWNVSNAESGAVAVMVEFQILSQWNGECWDDWSGYETHECRGYWWVVKKSRSINQNAVDQLVQCIGWDGDLTSVHDFPIDTTVQIKVEEDEWKGKTRYQAVWMNPEDFTPGGGGASANDVQKMQAQFGSLLRAAAGAAVVTGNGKTEKTAPQQTAPPPVDPQAPPPASEPATEAPPLVLDKDIPFAVFVAMIGMSVWGALL